MEKQKYYGRYRVASARAEWWEYDNNGAYFVTLNTQGRRPYFGEVQETGFLRYAPGIVADVLWRQIPLLNPDWSLGTYVVMPDHLHGILFKDGDLPAGPRPVEEGPRNIRKNSLSSVIGAYKSAVTKNLHRMGYDFEWQPRFHEQIIRDETHLNNVTRYIDRNLEQWWDDHGHDHPDDGVR